MGYTSDIKITFPDAERTPKVEEYEKIISDMVNKHIVELLDKEDVCGKMAEAIALGCPLLITTDGHVEVLK